MSDRSRHALGAVLPDVPLVEMVYQRRAKAERLALREAFDQEERRAFLAYLLAERKEELQARGFTERNLESLRYGKVPHGFNVHHIKPLDDGGDNRFSNLVLIRAEPEHKAIHRYLDPQIAGLEPGQSRLVKFPMPEAGAYHHPAQESGKQVRMAPPARHQAGWER